MHKATQCALKQYNISFVIPRITVCFHRCIGGYMFPYSTHTIATCDRLTVSLRNSPASKAILHLLLEKVADKVFGGSIKVFVLKLAVIL